ncbi:MAG: rhomboid family intramembrane serine protease [Myxococcota bacterium]
MFFPIGDEPNPPGRPVVTYALIAVNVLIYLVVSLPLESMRLDPSDPVAREYLDYLMRANLDLSPEQVMQYFSAYDAFVFQWGFKPGAPSITNAFSCMFLHSGWGHLLGNMWFLWIFGDNVEHRLGPVSYLVMYLLTGILGTLLFSVFAWGSMGPLIGASGAISGVQGFYFLWFPRNRVRVLVFVVVFLNIFYIPARFMIGFWLIFSNVLPVLSGVQSQVAYFAHIGGMLAGIGIAWLLVRYVDSSGLLGNLARAIDHRRAEQIEAGVNFTPIGKKRSGFTVIPGFGGREEQSTLSGPGGFSQAMGRGTMELALRIYAELTPDERNTLLDSEVMKLADYFTDRGDYDTAVSVLQRFIAQYEGSDRAARAHLRAGLIYVHFKRQPTTAAQHLHAVLDMNPSPEMEEVVRTALAQIES